MNIITDIKSLWAGLTAFLGGIVFNDITIPLFGVKLTVISMAAAGALVSFAYGKRVESRKMLYTLAAANTFIGSVAAAILPAALGWDWVKPELTPALAAVIAIAARWVVPAAIDLVPEFLRKILKLPPKDGPNA
jgi:hypothetical protein